MNKKKICFITCINDYFLYKECLRYINNLNIPENIEVETISINDAKSITEGYNRALEKTDAKYKVYLHQDTFIINKNFIYDMLEIFKNDEIGMIGVAGAKTIPTNGVWWESNHKYGQVYESHTGKMELLAFNEVKSGYEEVKAIDGLIMITQYDISWREDIFDGWHFYDVSQSTEFLLNGYKVVVPTQTLPWVLHDCGYVDTKENYEKYREVFLDEYSKKIFPLVSILIPAYNSPHYLKIALESALNQTYRNIEIIVCDDSTNNEVQDLMNHYLNDHLNVKYHRNKGINDALKNFDKCLSLSNGKYINYLMHDDVFSPIKIEKMIEYFLQYSDVSLVTSYRQLIDKNGNGISDKLFNASLTDKTTIIDGKVLGKFVIENLTNFIGEPTTVLFNKDDLGGMLGEYYGRRYYSNVDVAAWLKLFQIGKAVYIAEPLSSLRMHEKQNSKNLKTQILGIIEWLNLIRDSFNNKKYIEDYNDYICILNKWMQKCIYITKFNIEDYNLKKELFDSFEYAINEIINCKM